LLIEQSMMSRGMKSQAGFTILETLVTAGIAGTLAAVTFPSWSAAVNAHRLTSGLRTTVASIRAARSAAVSRNSDVRITVANGQTLTTEVYRVATNTWDAIGSTVTLDGGTTVSSVSPADGLVFHATGRVDNTVSVTVSNARGGTRQITVAVLGGVDLS
jgi:type II secretory pathway pseudopilin PulG